MSLKIIFVFFTLLLNVEYSFAQQSSYFDEDLEKQYNIISSIAPKDPEKALIIDENFIKEAKKKIKSVL